MSIKKKLITVTTEIYLINHSTSQLFNEDFGALMPSLSLTLNVEP